jgi:phosphoglycerate dehydrogenase-like enzyme
MKVAAGRGFYERYGGSARQIVPDIGWALLEPDGSWSAAPEECELIVLAGDGYTRGFVETTSALPGPRWAHTEDAGIDGPFYDAMRTKGAMLTHSPGANAPEVAEFALSFILWTAKRLGDLRAQQLAHEWRLLDLQSLSDKTLLVIGLGAIGSRVARYAKGFDMRVLGLRRAATAVEQVDRQGTLADLRAFLAEADFVVVALPLTPDTQGLIGKAELARMKPGATLVNIGRGAVVDIGAVRDALGSGQLGQACLDVLPTEPWPQDDPLWDTPNLFLTPHNAWSSPLYVPRVADIWLENLGRYVRGEALLHRAF